MSEISKTWHGIPRKEIPWFPTVDETKCIGCSLCFVTCGRNVYEMVGNKSKVVNPYNCLVGCTTCETVCPVGAISFPPKDMIHKIEKEHAVLRYVQKESKKKGMKVALDKARAEAERVISQSSHRVEFTVSGHILEKDVPKKLMDITEQCDCDVVNFSVNTPSLKVCYDEKAPSVAKFELVSQKFEDVSHCSDEIDRFLGENGFVIVEQKKIS